MKFKGILIDLSGTIHVEDTPIPGAIEAIEQLLACKRNIKVRFVSNTTKQSTNGLITKLQNMGFKDIHKQHVITSLNVALKYCQSRYKQPFFFLEDEAISDYTYPYEQDHDAVVVGLAPSKFTYENLTKAMRILIDRPNAELVAIHKGRYFERKDGLAMGPGAFVSALEFSTGKAAKLIGKPSKSFFDLVLSDINLEASECVMIGDDVKDDIGGAQASGMTGFLVQTGKYRKGDEENSQINPEKIFKSVKEAIDFLLLHYTDE